MAGGSGGSEVLERRVPIAATSPASALLVLVVLVGSADLVRWIVSGRHCSVLPPCFYLRCISNIDPLADTKPSMCAYALFGVDTRLAGVFPCFLLG